MMRRLESQSGAVLWGSERRVVRCGGLATRAPLLTPLYGMPRPHLLSRYLGISSEALPFWNTPETRQKV